MNNENIAPNNSGSDNGENKDLGTLFSHVARLMLRGRRFYGQVRPHGRNCPQGPRGPLHPAQGRVLAIIGSHGSINRKDLLEMTEVRSGSLSEVLGKLEKHGCITKTQDADDKRSCMLSITEKGKEIVVEHRKWREENAEDMFAALYPAERSQLAVILAKLAAAWNNPDCGGEEAGAERLHGCRREGRHGAYDKCAHDERGRGRGHGHGRMAGRRHRTGDGESDE